MNDIAGEVRYRVAFFFNAQLHQLLHGITTAIALARDPDFDVHVVGGSQAHLDYARAIVAHSGGAPITLSLVSEESGRRRPKLIRLAAAARHLAGFDAIALPERTSILLKRLGVRRPRFIHLDHGAGDRAVGFDPRIRLFDFVLLAGEKTRARMAREGYVRPGAHAVVGYPKFDAADAIRSPAWTPFTDPRPTVLYNPHFSELGSWRRYGLDVLRAFAGQDRYNLIFAPHVRLFDAPGARARAEADLADFHDCPNIHVDLGSDRSVDMTYTMLADLYLGDVSSQVYEFLRVPRPCLFLDAHGIAWEGDENYAHWRFGPVVRSAAGLIAAIAAAHAGHAAFRAAQAEGFAATFDLTDEPSSRRAARAIATFLRYGAIDRAGETGAPAAPPPAVRAPRRALWQGDAPATGRPRRIAARAAVVALMIGAGWAARGTLDPPAGSRFAAETIVDEALESDDATMVRIGMRSQLEQPTLDKSEIATATAIHLPHFPADWQISDVQIYPSDAGPGVQIALRTARGQPLTFLALRTGTPGGRDRMPRLARRGLQTVAYWQDGDLSMALVARGAPSAVRKLAGRLAPSGTRPAL